MKGVAWRSVGRAELAALLGEATPLSSHAVGTATVYRLKSSEREVLAIALPDGEAVVIESAPPPAKRRRRVDG